MENAIKQLILKLDHIDKRLDSIEQTTGSKNVDKQKEAPGKVQLDPLFKKALGLVESSNQEEFSTTYIQKQLSVDQKRAESIIDQLVAAGYGTSYMGEA